MTAPQSISPASAMPSTEEQLADYVYSIQNYTDAKEVAAHLWPTIRATQPAAPAGLIETGPVTVNEYERSRQRELQRMAADATPSPIAQSSEGAQSCSAGIERCPECGWGGGGIRDEGCMIGPCPRNAAQPATAWCQPMDCGKHTPRKFLLYFEDADRGIAVFDNEAEAREAFTKANTAWNCYLFGALPLSSTDRDLAKDYPAEVISTHRLGE